jgi:copper chaperone CopZ
MSCNSCVKKIEDFLRPDQSIVDIKISLEKQNVVIEGEDTLSNIRIKNSLEDLGFTVRSIKKI